MPTTNDEAKRTAPLAFWRYAHDYLQAAAGLCRDDHTLCSESQAPYHVAAQGLEFALHAWLRADGTSSADLRARYGRSLVRALAQCEAQGMPPMPARWQPEFRALAECHQDHGFEYFTAAEDAFPDVGPLVDAGVWILDHAAPRVAAHYVQHLGGADSPTVDEFVRRLRAALTTLSSVAMPPLHYAGPPARERGTRRNTLGGR